MKKIVLYFSILFISSLVVSCDSEVDDFGVSLFNADAGIGNEEVYDLKVYNVSNGDKVRADSYALRKAVLGAFTEVQFGMQKASYITQLRLSSYAPNFGVNPIVDSVVLEFQPGYLPTITNSMTSKIVYNGQDATQVVNSYYITKYGNENNTLTLKVSEVLDDLGSIGTEILSNKVINEGNVIGSKGFNGSITSVNIKKESDNSVLLSKEAGVRILLDKEFFQTKIADKNGKSELETESNFINYFKGIKLYVQEKDGYLMTFAPNGMQLRMYYTSGEIGSRKSSYFDFNLGSSNVHFSQIAYERSDRYKTIMSNSNSAIGDALVYAQGMGGSGVGVKLTGSELDNLKTLYKEKKSAIISAKVRLYTDMSVWNNSYPKPTNFLVKELGSSEFITDIKTMLTNANYRLVTAYATNSNLAYYDIDITKTIKDIVEQGVEAKDLVINVGDYLTSSTGVLVAENYNTNVYSPYRVVFVGTDSTNEHRAKLLITRVTK